MESIKVSRMNMTKKGKHGQIFGETSAQTEAINVAPVLSVT